MPVGDPGGPDSEIFFHFPQVTHDQAYGRCPHQNSDGGTYLEIGNSVFMQYRRTEDGFAELPRPNVDFGGGLERIAAASIDSPDVYRIDTLWPIVKALETLSGRKYEEHTVAMRVITDHIRAAGILATDGVVPGNKAQPYVLRRLIRRALRYAVDLDLTRGVAEALVPVVAETFRDEYPEFTAQQDRIVAVLSTEERTFGRTLSKGVNELHKRGRRGLALAGIDLFELYDTFGMPVELSVEEAKRAGLPVTPAWRAEFADLMAEQRARSQRARG